MVAFLAIEMFAVKLLLLLWLLFVVALTVVVVVVANRRLTEQRAAIAACLRGKVCFTFCLCVTLCCAAD